MATKKSFPQLIEEICFQDERYKPDSYEFVMQALTFTQNRLKRAGHISGRELSEGIRDLAIEQYGPMARNVLEHWGLGKTEDFGNIVFNMITKKILSKNESDSIDDFKEIFDFQLAFSNILRDSVIKGLK